MRTLVFASSLRAPALVLALVCALTIVATQPALGQTFTALHDFTGGGDGGNSEAGLTADSRGNLYGTASVGGLGYGIVFKLAHQGSGWFLTPLYTFQGGDDGSHPTAKLVVGPDGALYGTTLYGGGGPCRAGDGMLGCGTVFRLTPNPSICRTVSCPWTETILYRFGRVIGDGTDPFSSVTFDRLGNLYGTTDDGGVYGLGTVYELVYLDGGWSESVLYSFSSGPSGNEPQSGVVFDGVGNLFGTTTVGGQGCTGNGCGVVYELSPSGSGWTETVLYSFTGGNDGAHPYGGVIFGPAGVLYGTTVSGGLHNPGGTVFQLTPSHGTWTLTTLYSLSGSLGPDTSLVMDGAGNLYGTTVGDGAYQAGSVFKLEKSGGSWIFGDLHSFSGSDGSYVIGSVVFDAAGNLYGTTYFGGTYVCIAGGGGCGVAWEITP